MILWLKLVGVSWWIALLIVAMMMLAHLTAARVVAETGLPIFRGYASPGQVYMRMNPSLVSGRDVYFAQVFTETGAYVTRESALTFAQHGLWVFDNAVNTGSAGRRRSWIGALVAWALLVSFIVGCGSFLHAYYTHLLPLTQEIAQRADTHKINPYGTDYLQRVTVATPLTQYAAGRFPPSPYNPAAHIGGGAIVTAALSFLSLRYASWPFLPVGYVIATTNFIEVVWYSVLVGWLAKVLVLRFGGAKLFQAGKPLFIGLMVGEALCAGAWLVVNLVLAGLGSDYRPVILYPS
jgi:hypothetical protein